jgi:hypothetical protein
VEKRLSAGQLKLVISVIAKVDLTGKLEERTTMEDMTVVYVAMAIQAVINAVLLFVVLQQSRGLQASIPPQVFPAMLDFIRWVAKMTPTKSDDAVLDGLFPELPAQEVQKIVDQAGRDVAQAMESAAS